MLGRTVLLFPPKTRQFQFLAQTWKRKFPLPSIGTIQPTRSQFPTAFTQKTACFPRESPFAFTYFRQLLPPKAHNEQNLLKNPSYYSIEVPKYISFGKREKPNNKKVPKLILIQNPFTWLMAKIDFRVLKSIWDPQFVEEEFKMGAKQAISRVTQVISEGKYDDLNGLLTKPARLNLMRDLDRNWNQQRRAVLALKRDDIQISSPRKVHFIRIDDKRFCDVDMCFMALKWVPMQSKEALIFADIFARFHREYTPHSIPEWTIAFFKVKRLQLVRAKTV